MPTVGGGAHGWARQDLTCAVVVYLARVRGEVARRVVSKQSRYRILWRGKVGLLRWRVEGCSELIRADHDRRRSLVRCRLLQIKQDMISQSGAPAVLDSV